ncbi:trimethylamine methyltransferase family protein [Candidatus Bipolaricaulota bacterium]|nr:trimethylamine methyltransferase family protein [Candidatus Bipolaricaulota bacterium]
MCKKGLIGDKYNLLRQEEIEKIHESSLWVLEEVGVRVDDDHFLTLFGKAGANINRNERLVKLPASMVEEFVGMAPGEVLLAGRNSENDLLVGGRRVYLGTGGAAIHILDLETGKLRDPILQDQYNLAWLTENLDNVHFYQCPVVCTDIPKEVVSINSFYAALAGTRKNVQESATDSQAARDIIEMAAMIAGGEEALRERPFISFVTSWMISPLKLDIGTSRVLETVASHGIPVSLSSAPVTGSTAPATLAGLLTLVHAEELFGITLAQIVREGTPILYGPVPAVANMRNMAYLGGAVETGMMNAAAVQMANYINVPIYSDAGQTDSKLPDIQAGYEKGANILQVAMAGGNYIHHAAGMLESMLTVSYEQFVIDNDINGMALRALQGIKVNDDTLALDVIKAVGPGGNYLTQRHTLKYARSDEFYIPSGADRSSRAEWEKAGGKDARERAREIARGILNQERPQLIPSEIDSQIRRRFDIRLP